VTLHQHGVNDNDCIHSCAYEPGVNSSPTLATSYAYDGQMGVEDVDAGSSSVVTDYALGARSIERIAKTTGGSTNVMYPLYDGHGNMVSTLSLSGVSFSTANQRSFDAWGNVRGGNSSGDPKGRYCANVGHKQDDESGLIYMRARYYEATSGRFISEDPSHSGANWARYCNNDPINQTDATGRDSYLMLLAAFGVLGLGIAAMIQADAGNIPGAIVMFTLAMAVAAIAESHSNIPLAALQADLTTSFAAALGVMFSGCFTISKTLAANAGLAVAPYCMACFIELACDSAGD